jgi:hypothetical protein
MISIYYNTTDRFSLYGISHFFQKFGIPFVINDPSSSGVIISYGLEKEGDYVISICENEIKNQICGNISSFNDTIPVCEIPRDSGSENQILAYFENRGIKYPCLTYHEKRITIGVDIFKETGYLLSGHFEKIWGSLDEPARKGLSSKPVVDFLEHLLFKAVLKTYHEKNIPLIHKSFWPAGTRSAMCLTHDVDEVKKTYQWITRPARCLLKLDITGFNGQVQSLLQKIKGNEPYWTFDDICSLEKTYGGCSTFFFLEESGKSGLLSPKTWNLYGRSRYLRDPEVLRAIRFLRSEGKEIAIHGSYYSYLDEDLLKKETKDLTEILQKKVIGIRQHHLNLKIPETWYYQNEAGLKYDTSLGFKDRVGFRWGTTFPFYPYDGKTTLPIHEIPLHIMDICLLSSDDPIKDWMPIADEVERYEGVLGVLWHPPVFNNHEVPGAREIYSEILRWGRGHNAWITSARNISGWFMQRDKISFTWKNVGNEYHITPTPINGSDQFLTIHFPPNCEYEIPSGNVKIIRKEIDISGQNGDCVYVQTQNLEKNKEIVVKIS